MKMIRQTPLYRRLGGRTGRALLSATLLAALGVTVVHAVQNRGDTLKAPAGYYQIPQQDDGGDYDCDIAKPHTGAMAFTSKYKGSDSARNELNKKAKEEYRQAVEKVRRFEKAVVAATNDYQVDGDGDRARDCVLENLDLWASADALNASQINHVGQAVRKWALAAAANSYLRVKLSAEPGALPAEQQQRIEDWFQRLTVGIREYYTDRPARKVNNHDYWAAWAVMSASVATQNRDDWDWALGKFDEAMGQITQAGYLPKELSRETRALEYLNYAMQPLTLIAVFAEVNDESVHDRYQADFEKLAQNVVLGLESPERIARVADHQQIADGLFNAWSLAWMEPWQKTWGNLQGMSSFLDEHRPMKSTRLGGDLTYLYQVDPTWPLGSEPEPPGNVRLRN